MTDSNKGTYAGIFRFSYFIFISVIIILGLIMVNMVSSFYKSSKLNELREKGTVIVNLIEKTYSNYGEVNVSDMNNVCKAFADGSDITVYIYNSAGRFLASSDGIKTSSLPADTQQKLIQKDYLNINNSTIAHEVPEMLYATYFSLTSTGRITDYMYLFVYDDIDDINLFTMNTILIYTFFSIVGLLAVLVFMSIRTKKYMDYENNFRRISEQYSKGDFSEKIPVDIPGIPNEIASYVNTIATNVATSEETSKTFIANVSHELRTPMTTIGGFVDGILDGTIPKSRRNEYLVLVSNEIQRLRILITSMLNMSRFESGTMRPNFKEINLTDIVIRTVFMFEKKIEEKHLEVEELDSEKLVAVADGDLIQQVIYNLIENAVKFINEGGTLSFRFEKENGMCTVGIKNTGEGLKDSEIQQVFDRFYKTDSSRGKDTTGLGLGLSISRKIIHLHNGHIVVKSVYGEYTEFLIQIPEKQP